MTVSIKHLNNNQNRKDMLKLKIIILHLLLIIVALTNAQTISIKVMSMNIKEGGMIADFNADAFCTFIRQYNPDFISFQEMDNFTNRNGKKDLLIEMAAKLGMFPYFGNAFSYDSGDFGVAILSKYPFFNAKTIVSKPTGAREPRSCSWVDVVLPNKRTVRVAATHLDVAPDDQIRITMLASINSNMLTNNSFPTLLIGDFNATPESAVLSYASFKWQDIGAGTGNTIPSTGPTIRIDYVLGYPKTWIKKSYEIICQPQLSDHCFIVAEVEHP